MKNRSIKIAILLPVLSVLIVGIAAMILIVGRSSYSTANKLTGELVHSTVDTYVNEFKAVSTGAYASISSATPIIEKAALNSENPREEIVGILEGALMGNPQIVSIWTCWEPNSLDGKDDEYKNQFLHDGTGRFIPVIIRDGYQIDYEPLIGYESPETGEYYHGAKSTAKPYITDPYEYVLGGKNTLLYTISIPIVRDGHVVGVAGADVDIVANVDKGAATANEASESIEKVNKIAVENAQAMETLSAMSNQQTVSIEEINAGMSQISSVVQANSATSEESAAAAEEMNAQNNMLNDIIRRFKLRKNISLLEGNTSLTHGRGAKQLESKQLSTTRHY